MSKISLDSKLEKKLIQKARKNKADFAPLYKHYHPHILRYLNQKVSSKEQADEITSIVFEKALNAIDNFQWQGVPFSAWLYQIARNTLIDFYRTNEKEKKVSYIEDMQFESKEENPLEKLESTFEEDLLYKLIDQLNEKEKEIIYLKFFDGYTNRLIAQITELSETNVGTIVYRAIKKLREMYSD